MKNNAKSGGHLEQVETRESAASNCVGSAVQARSWILWGAVLLTLFFGVACGGASPISLEEKGVVALRPMLSTVQALCPGQNAGLIVEVELVEGDVLRTRGAGGGRVAWSNFEVQTTGASVASNGDVWMDEDPRVTWERPAEVHIRSVHHPELSEVLIIPANYDCRHVADFRGERGRHGEDGRSGATGEHGQGHSSSGSAARPGGNGAHGGHGGNGGDGESARDGDDVEVFVTRWPDADGEHLHVVVQSMTTQRAWEFVVHPAGGAIVVDARGGVGGRGGSGGGGGSGGSGGTGDPPGAGGHGGDGGDGGSGGDGGDGGRIAVYAAPEAMDDAQIVLDLLYDGGSGGSRGQAGAGGSGGGAHSGAEAGHSGAMGREGQRDGRRGRRAPEPSFVIWEDAPEVSHELAR